MTATIHALPQVRPPMHFCAKCERYDSTTVCKYCTAPMEQTTGQRIPAKCPFQQCTDCRAVLCAEFEICARRSPDEPEAA